MKHGQFINWEIAFPLKNSRGTYHVMFKESFMMATSNTSFSWVESRANFFKCLKFTLRMTFLTKSFFHFKYCSHFTCIWLLSSVAAPLNITIYHFVKSFQMRSFFWSVFFCIWTEYRDLFGQFSPSVYYNNWYLIQFHPFRIFVCSYLVFSSTPQLSVTQSSMVQLLIKNRSSAKGQFLIFDYFG